jgi:outer membrane protein assembly factor BamA
MRYLAVILSFLCVLLIWGGCNPTVNLSKSQSLLVKNTINSDKPEFNDDLRTIIKQHPNKKLLGLFRFQLGVYNLVTNTKPVSDTGKVRRWARVKNWIRKTIGEEPVIYDSLATHRSMKQMQLFLYNKGFFNAMVKDSVSIRKKKAKVHYFVKTATPYTIRNITIESKDSAIKKLLQNETGFLLKTDDRYDASLLQKEREQFTLELKNVGYYFFSKEFIYFKIDSSLNSHQVDIVMGVRIINENSKTAKESIHHTYKINQIYIQEDFKVSNLDVPKDTIVLKEVSFISYSKELPFKPDIILQKVYITEGDLYRNSELDKTYRGLSDLGVFKFTNIRFEEVKDSNAHMLNCYILLTPSAKESFSIESEGTYNAPNLGVAGNIAFRNKNLFRGAELFEFKLKGALEAQKTAAANPDDAPSLFNTIRVGPEASLNFQNFLLPFKINTKRYLNPRTTIPVSYNYEKRPLYNRATTNISINYSWNAGRFKSHAITPIEVSKIDVEKSLLFEEKLKILKDPFISNSYRTHLTTISRYTFFFNNQNINKKVDFVFFRFNTEFSGNILRGINGLLNSPKEYNNVGGYSYKIFGVNYSQFIRPEFDFRYYKVFTSHNTLVYRVYSGLGLAYGNSSSLPIEKLFFAGGASDIRGWSARTLGPGSYQAPVNSIDQNGDLKLEANLEYRFYLLKLLEGAAFIDAGNIWAINDSARPGSQFYKDKFLDQVAIAGGLGARFNFTFFIFRIDAGVKMKDPSKEGSDRFVLRQTKVKDINWNIGIGYPF